MPDSTCNTAHNETACAYDYGYGAAQYAFTHAPGGGAGAWWLDVETANSWSTDFSLNLSDIQGSIDYLHSQNVVKVGIYSTSNQWGQIANGAKLALPSWVAGALNAKRAASMCTTSFTGGAVSLVQYPSSGFDADYVC